MSGKSDSRLWRAVLKVVVLLVMLSVVPIALIWLVGNPLPESIPDPEAIELAVHQRNVPGEVVVKTLSVLLWVVWGQLAWSTLWEVLFAGPRRARGHRTSGAPLVSRWMNRVVGRVVSGLFAAGVVIGSANLSASVGPEPLVSTAPMAVVGSSSVRAVTAELPTPEAQRATTTVLVEPGESLWSLADGDVAVSRQILKMNPMLDSALDVVAGLEVIVPAELASISGHEPLNTSPTEPRESAPSQPRIEVEAGDSLWAVARRQLEDGQGSPNLVDLSEYVDELIVRNPQLADNPDLIFPGDLLVLPAQELSQAVVDGVSPLGVSGGTVLPNPDTGPSEEATTRTPNLNQASVAPSESVHQPEASETGSTSPALYLSGVGSLLLCSGFVGLLQRRRRYLLAHRRPGLIPSDPPARLRQVERLLNGTHQPDLAEWLTAGLRSLSARPSWPDDPAAAPVTAEIDDEQLIVTLVEPDPLGAPLPWTTKNGGRTWQLLRSWTVDDLPRPRTEHPFPSFVTIGEKLMLNLEATPVLSIVGADDQSEDLVRSIAVELTTSPMGGLSSVWATPAVAHLCPAGSASVESAETLVDQILEAAKIAGAQLSEASAVGIHHYRLIGGQPAIDPMIVFCSSNDLEVLDPLLHEARQSSAPLIVIVLGQLVDPEWVLRCSRGRVNVEPIGISVQGSALSASVADGLEALLSNSDPDMAGDQPTPGPEPVDSEAREKVGPPPLELRHPLMISNGATPTTQAEARPVLGIRLLGPIEVLGIEGTLTPQQLSLVSFLACNESVTRSEISEALWDGRAMSPGRFPNLLAEVRNRIGREHLPDAVNGHYRLAHVEIDVQDFERLRSVPSPGVGPGERSQLVEALELVRGVPLTAPGGRYWHWVENSAHLAARLESQVADTALCLAAVAQDADDNETAQWAIQQGLLAAPLDESLTTALAVLYVALGKSRAAKRLVENWEASVTRLDCGPPSDGPRLSLAETNW